MVESIMLFGVGYLAASLLGLALISVVHQRAVGLTERRLADERCRLEGMITRTRTRRSARMGCAADEAFNGSS
jgi:hypothetical protein